ncbi:lipoprotein [Streptomyces sp. NBRC 14336]|uniref:DUF4349 domain-containing protein n=1 Tax=Streptomyces sp. NBRC 14336 TaxID=3030992 RepID=UPI0024A0294B|nr:DUF4349 domain-containing protein [Streptomyces sp. NBRC 14336]GLW48301.1 lipoprotein [Streptomyces sp. NBRC 14336]
MHARRSVRPGPALAGLLLAAALALTGCSGAGDDSGGSSDTAKEAAAQSGGEAAAGPAAGDYSAEKGRKADTPPKATASHIIRTASLTVQVKDVPKALDEVRAVTEDVGGYVGNETTTRDGKGRERTRVVLRVPVASYADVLADLEGTGKLLERTAKAQDVTEQVVDVESRIKTQRASVARIRALMDEATKLSDVVVLEGELSTRQADLESLLAQQAALKDRTSLATITLSLSETPVKKAAAEDDDPGVLDALTGGWGAFLTVLRWIVMAAAAVLPFAAGAALLIFLWLRLVHPRLAVRRERTPATPVGPLPTAYPAPAPGSSPASEED